MRVLLVSQKPNAPTITGEMVFVENLTRGLEGAGISIERCEVGSDFLPGKDLSRLVRYTRIPGLVRCRSALRKAGTCDIIHFLDSSLAPAGLSMKGKKVATSHILGRSHYRFRNRRGIMPAAVETAYSAYSNILDGFAFRRMDGVVAESPFHRDDLISTFGLEEPKVEVIPPGVDTIRIGRAKKLDLRSMYGHEKTVAYIARLDSPAKGLSDYIEAAAALSGEDIAFLIVGEGSERPHFESIVRERGLGGSVFFLGAMDFDSKSAIQKSADAVVIPSVSETFCMVFAESLAAGTPVVAYDLPFWKGLYGGAGVFAGPGPASLAQSIRTSLDDLGLRGRLISRGLSLAKVYDVKNTVSAYLGLYGRLLQ